MATVDRKPAPNGRKFRDGCAVHWQVRPNPSEVALGVGKETFCRQGPATARAGEIRDKIHRGLFVADDKTTLAEWVEQSYTAAVVRGDRPASLESRRVAARLRILPVLGHLPVTAIRREDVEKWAAELPPTPRGRAAEKAVSMLRALFNEWMERGRPLPRGNPVPRYLIKTPEKKYADPLTVAQVHAWRDALPEDMRGAFEVEAYTGSRMSEVLGLREEDLVWIGRDTGAPLADQLRGLAELPAERYAERKVCLRFQRQLGRRGYYAGASVGAPTKNRRANRAVPLDQSTVAFLADSLTAHAPVGGWLFTNSRQPGCEPGIRKGAPGWGSMPATHRRPFTHTTYRVRLNKAARDAGVTLPANQCSHALRHHCVSVLRDRGFSDQAIGEWIGDSAVTVQLVYGRPMPDSMDRMSAAMADAHAAPRLRLVGNDG